MTFPTGVGAGRPLVSPSILASDFSRLGEEIAAVDAAGADWVHVDVMDGHFVPNITIGPAVVAALRPWTTKPLDVHLMIAPVDPYVSAFVDAGADLITVHAESSPHVHRTLGVIREHGMRAGVALNPGTPVAVIEPLLDDVDLVLVMSVDPGFGGQRFVPSSLDRVAAVAELVGERPIDIEVDGGVTDHNAAALHDAGATVLVAGSAVFRGGAGRYVDNIAAIAGAATTAVRANAAVVAAAVPVTG